MFDTKSKKIIDKICLKIIVMSDKKWICKKKKKKYQPKKVGTQEAQYKYLPILI